MKDYFIYIENYVKALLILLFFCLCIYLAKSRNFYIETFAGFNEYQPEKIEKLIDREDQKKIILNKCYESERKYEGPGFECLRVGYYCINP
jgi:hypothetical protein